MQSDGASSASLVATLLDNRSNPMAGQLLSLSSSRGVTDVISPASATGIVNGARTFNGSQQLFQIATNPSLETGAVDFTFTAWVNMVSKSTNRDLIGQQIEGASPVRDYALYYDASFDRIIFQVFGPDGVTPTRARANSLGSPATDTWYFLAGATIMLTGMCGSA